MRSLAADPKDPEDDDGQGGNPPTGDGDDGRDYAA